MGKVLSKRIRGGTYFKLILVGSVITHVLVTTLFMILVALGFFQPTQAGEPMPLLKSELFLAIYLIAGVLLVIPIWAGVLWLSSYPGIWILSKFRATEIHYHDP